MSKKFTVPEVDVEIGENLYLRLKEVSYYPGSPEVRYYKDGSGHPGDAAEVDWKESMLVIRKTEYKHRYEMPALKEVKEYDFSVDDDFANEYYEQILEATEETLNEQ